MAERVMVVSRVNGRAALLDARVARVLVTLGSHEYVATQAPEPAPVEPARKKATPKKRAYKRRDMQAED